MEERYIASVDLGTSKIAVCIARILDQNVQVIYYKETLSRGIRYSYVFNPKMVEDVIKGAISEAQQDLKIKIGQVVVGLPRFHVRQETASAVMEREDENSQIENEELSMLKSMALETYPLKNMNTEVIYGAVAQSFSTEDSFNELESDIVGMTAATLEGNFKVFIGNRRHSLNINNVFKNLGIGIAKKYFTPGITAKAILKQEQMENGVALIDLGAGASSVTVFEGKIMRFYAAIPFGGNSITMDIKSECGISTTLAENIKKSFGKCQNDKLSSYGTKTIQINDENDSSCIQVGTKYLSEIIDARMSEIIKALIYAVQESGYGDKLRSGIVLTGGGSEMVNVANFVKEIAGCTVSIGKTRPFFSYEGCQSATDPSATTCMGMILAAKTDRSLNCTSRPVLPASVKPAEKKAETPKAAEPAVQPAPVKPAMPAAEPVQEPVQTPPIAESKGAKTAERTKAPAQKVIQTANLWDQKEYSEPVPDWDGLPRPAPVAMAEEFEEDTTSSIEKSVRSAQESDNGYTGTVFEKQEEKKPEGKKKEDKKKNKSGRAGGAIIKWIQHMYDQMDSEEV